ncbi:MAG TPA: hypothetical protein VF297_16000 [Pyrinomonadaceae bacterium]
MRSALKSKWLFPVALFAALLCAAPARAQEPAADDEEGSRQIKLNNGITKARPSGSGTNKSKPATTPVYKRVDRNRVDTGAWTPATTPTPAPKPQPTPRKPRRGNQTAQHTKPPAPKPNPAPKPAGELLDIGVTVWRMRSGKVAGAEPGVSFPTGDDLAERVTPVRLSGTDPVQLGDRLRLMFESPLKGYLYIINRTQYDDDTISDPELIFPTKRTRGGDNSVSPGRPVFIPDTEDRPSYFRVSAEGPDGRVNTGEIIYVIVSPKPIPELTTSSRDKVKISLDMLKGWTSTWGDEARQQQFELEGGEGRPATVAEHKAGASVGSKALTQDEPLPQNIYRVPANPNGPTMVTVQLTYKDSAPKKSSEKKSSAKN